jgi:aminoglycoside phosphotransferase (APT) family kinase protein
MDMPMQDRLELIGRGYCADVFAFGNGRVLKLFRGPLASEQADREFAATRAVHSAGLPAPDAYEVVGVEGRPGIVFERIVGVSLLEHTQKRPWRLFRAVRLAAELHAEIHTHTAPTGLPSLRDRINDRIGISDSPETDKRMARTQLAALPDGTTLCHGDFHPANILLTPRGPAIIDWSSASRGHPLGDVGWTIRLMRTAKLPPWSPWFAHLLLRCFRTPMSRRYLDWYLRQRPGTRREIEDWQAPLAVAVRHAI